MSSYGEVDASDERLEFFGMIEQLEAELAAEQQRSAGHRAHYEHERERADLLARSHEKLDIQLKNLRLHLQAGRQAAPRTLRD
jgi:hypothetical protein